MDLSDAIEKDFSMLSALPGKKIILKGNHDYWWSSMRKLEQAFKGRFQFLHNSCVVEKDTAICGTRGWNLPSMPEFTDHDDLLYKREVQRLEHSLKEAKSSGAKRIIAALHYPPLYEPEEVTGFTELCRDYEVTTCIYGHVHGDAAHFLNLFQGVRWHAVPPRRVRLH